MAQLMTKLTPTASLGAFALCIGVALVLGLLTSLLYNAGVHHTASFSLAIVLLPPVVSLIILLVQGNIGAGLSVAGTFALVRFRSFPGTAREITGLFLALALGIACGMGYIGLAVLFFAVMLAVVSLLKLLHFGEYNMCRQLKITVPEELDYDDAFDDVLNRYTSRWELVRVRTTNMGTLYELTFDVVLPSGVISKQFLDELRCLNGNLNVVCGRESDRESM